ncbi:CapA family protein [Mesorhizobium sp. M0045]|uniref:CapA family protein n=1 Tax=Mesorhizobium sp. M0045 TaxID=2956857 RepID=UPI003338D911
MHGTSRALDENGIIHAGAGESLAQADAARFMETARGAATFAPMARACNPAGEAPGRPGLNALRLTKSIVVPREMLESLRRIHKVLPGYNPAGQEPNRVVLGGVIYKAGDKADYSFEANARDVANILRNVRRGKQFSGLLHCHEPRARARRMEPGTADYEQSFARRLIYAGADAYVEHGPHLLRGIEIYKRRPIFYSLSVPPDADRR